MMYEIFTGRLPFVAEDEYAQGMMKLTATPTMPNQINPNLDEQLAQVIFRCIQLRPEQRFQSAGELLQTLIAIQARLAPPEVCTPAAQERSAPVQSGVSDPLIGKMVGPYQIIEWIRYHRIGHEYKAFHPERGYVALVLSQAVRLSHAFSGEARFSAALIHPHILPVYEIHETKPDYVVTRLIEGESRQKTLRHVIDAKQLFDLPRTAAALQQVASAIDYAHEHNVVCCYINPSNILLDRAGNAFLSNPVFDIICREMRLSRSTDWDDTYFPPEIPRSQILSRGDIYSLGIVLYEMVAGRPPFVADNPLIVLNQYLHNLPPAPRLFNSRLTTQVERVILKAIAKKPSDRYASAGEFAHAFSTAVKSA